MDKRRQNTWFLIFLLTGTCFGTLGDIIMDNDGNLISWQNNGQTMKMYAHPSASESYETVFPFAKGTPGQALIIDGVVGDVITHAYSSPSSFASHQILSPTHTDAETANIIQGDILYGFANGDLRRLPVGTALGGTSTGLLAHDGTNVGNRTLAEMVADMNTALDLEYLRLDTTNNPLTGDLDFGGNDILSSGAIGFKVSGVTDKYWEWSIIGGVPSTTIKGAVGTWSIFSDATVTAIGIGGSIQFLLGFDSSTVGSLIQTLGDLDITTASINNGDINLSPGGTGVVNIESDLIVTGYASNKNFTDSAHYTGFPNRTDTTLSFDDATATLTLTPTNSTFEVWKSGVVFEVGELTNQLTSGLDAASGLYWYWITAPGGTPQLNSSLSHPGFDQCLVATVYWNTTTNLGLMSEERHWFGRDQWQHESHHEAIGAQFAFGMALTLPASGTSDDFQLESGEFYDEDIEHVIGQQTVCTVLYHNGDTDWEWVQSQDFAYKTNDDTGNGLSDDTIQYNNVNALVDVGNNKYVNYWVFISSDTVDSTHIVIGSAQHTLLTSAQNESIPALGALPSTEEALIFKITYRNTGGTATFIEVTDFRGITGTPTSGFVPTSHMSLSDLVWTSSNHSGTASTIASFDSLGLAHESGVLIDDSDNVSGITSIVVGTTTIQDEEVDPDGAGGDVAFFAGRILTTNDYMHYDICANNFCKADGTFAISGGTFAGDYLAIKGLGVTNLALGGDFPIFNMEDTGADVNKGHWLSLVNDNQYRWLILGDDGVIDFTPLIMDMTQGNITLAGALTLTTGISGDLAVDGDITIPNIGFIGSFSKSDAIQIEGNGDVNFVGKVDADKFVADKSSGSAGQPSYRFSSNGGNAGMFYEFTGPGPDAHFLKFALNGNLMFGIQTGSVISDEFIIGDNIDLLLGGTGKVTTGSGGFTDGTLDITGGSITDIVSLAGADLGITAGTGDYTGQNMTLTLSATEDSFCIDGSTNSRDVAGISGIEARIRIQDTSSGTFTHDTFQIPSVIMVSVTTADATANPATGAAATITMETVNLTKQWSGDIIDARFFGGDKTNTNRTLSATTEWSGTITSSGNRTLTFDNIAGVFRTRTSGTLNETSGTLIFNNVAGDFRIDTASSSMTVTGTPQVNFIAGRFNGTGITPSGGSPVLTSTGGLFTAGGADTNIGIDVTDVSGGIAIAIRTGTGGIIFGGLPNSDPSVAGQLYHDSGTVKISAGP